MTPWTQVFASRSSLAAQLARAALEGAGIATRTLGEDRVPGAFGVDFLVEVLVAPGDLRDARSILGLAPEGGGELSLVEPGVAGAVSIAEEPGHVTLVTCPHCGADWEPGFDVCWSCERPAD